MLTAVIKFISALGTEALYIPLILLIFWLIDEKRGLRLGILVIVSAWVNLMLKALLKQPRPYNLDPSLGLAFESTYGAPSGHAQNSFTFWILMAVWLSALWPRRKSLVYGAVIFFIVLMGFTRLYLGVHFPTDLLLGWLTAGIILIIWFFIEKKLDRIGEPRQELTGFRKIIASMGSRFQNILTAVAALIMTSLYPQDQSFAALFLGFCLGYTLMKQRFPFSAKGEVQGTRPGLRIIFLRCLTGFTGIAAIYLLLKLLLPGEGSLFSNSSIWGSASPYSDLGRFIRYGLIGFWASAGAPWLFRRIGLAE